jgi:hypothetical protein
MKACRGVDVWIHVFLISAVDARDEWTDSTSLMQQYYIPVT